MQDTNEPMTTGDAARWLGWDCDTPEARRRSRERLVNYVRRVERKSGMRVFCGGRKNQLTQAAINQFLPELLKSRVAKNIDTIRGEISHLHAEIDARIDLRIESHPIVRRHTSELEELSSALLDVAKGVRRLASGR